MKKTILSLSLILFFSTTLACVPPMFKQAQKDNAEVMYCSSLRSTLIDNKKSDIFRDVLTDFVNAQCFDVLK